MRRHPLLPVAVAVTACLAAAAGQAAAGPMPVLDGRRVTTLTLTVDSPSQAQLPDPVTGDRALDCERPRCSRLPFVYFPAKGVRSAIAFTVTWTSPLTDVDLHVAEVDAVRGNLPVTACASKTGGNSERVFLPADFLRRGTTYVLIADIQHSAGDRVTSRVTMPGHDEVPTTVPSTLDRTIPVNCGR